MFAAALLENVEPAPTAPHAASRHPDQLHALALFAHVRQQRHEPGTLDRTRHCPLTDRCTSSLAASEYLPLPVGKFLQQVNVFVIDVHGPGTLPVDEDGVLFLCAKLGFCPPFAYFSDL